MKTVGSLFLLSLALLVLQGHSLCDNSADVAIADACYKLDEQLQYALLQDKGNLYRLRKAFFYAPNAHPVLLRVIYNVTYAENATLQATYCTNDASNELSVEDTSITLGWTSTGVFTVFHPLTLNFMQIQAPFVLMTVFYHVFNAIHPEGSGPEADTFLWNGGYDLPTLRLNLYFTNLTCIPSEDLFNSVLSDFNSLLRVYAGVNITGIIQDSGNTRYVGFSLPNSSVTAYHAAAKSDFWLYVVYVLSTFVLYASCLTTIFFVISKNEQRGIKSFTKRNPEVLMATIIVIGSFVLVEVIAKLVMAIIWTRNVDNLLIGFTVFAAAFVYYGPGIFSLYKVGRKCYRYHLGKDDMRDVTTRLSTPLNDVDAAKIDAVFKCFMWIIAYFAYVLLYSFFPAFVLAFAYPTRVITIFAFIVTFLILSIVYLTTYIKKGITLKSLKDYKFIKIIICIILMILLLYFFIFVFALLYSLVIGRASVVNSAPLALLSLLPSILISIVAWVMKSTLLNSNSGSGRSVTENDYGVEHVDRENKIESDGSVMLTSYKKLKSNEGRETIGLMQYEESRSYEVNETKKAFQDGGVISNAMLIQSEEGCAGEEHKTNGEGSGDGESIVLRMRLIQKEETYGMQESETENETKI